MNIDLRPDRKLARASGGSVRFVLARIEAPAAPARGERTPIDLAFVLDRSGSMGGQKIELAREGALTGIRSLRAADRFAVVIYDSEVEVIARSTPASAAAKREVEQILRSVEARAMTDLAGGWRAGCEQVESSLAPGTVGRCLLLTDGLANVGITDPDELVGLAKELAGRGVATSTFGVGREYNEVLLEQMATAGGGNYYFIESAVQIPDFLASEVGEAAEVVARDAVLEVKAPAGVQVESLNGLAAEKKGRRFTFKLGPLVSEQLLDLVFRLRFGGGAEQGETVKLQCTLSDAQGGLAAESASVKFRYAGHRENDGQPRDHEVDRAVARAFAARARAVALRHNRAGEYDVAVRVLVATAGRIRGYSAGDAEMLAWADELEHRQQEYGVRMDAYALKMEHSLSGSVLKSRDSLGRAVRRRDRGDQA